MPKAVKAAKPAKSVKTKRPMTLGDLAQKISRLQANQILYALLLVAVFLLGYLFARVQALEGGQNNGIVAQTQGGDLPAEPLPGEQRVDGVEVGHFPIEGDESAQVTIVEFSDFECPFCESFFTQTLPQIKSEYVDTGKVKFYYRHFPLSFHPAANPAALASECANEQGAFWAYHDKVFSEQSRIAGGGDAADTALKEMAVEVGLNSTQFDQCFDSAKYQASIDEDVAAGSAAGVTGTPTLYINGRKVVGAQPYATFKAIIDEELNQ